jgi:lysozyme family protein
MSFSGCLEFVLAREGGKSDDPKDRGGRTAYGVTQKVYDQYLAEKGAAKADVWTIPPADVAAIYRSGYWDAIHGDDLCAASPEVALATFDAAVNHGPGRAVRMLQKALGAKEDGQVGPKTLEALHLAAATGYPRVLRRMLAARDLFFRRIVAGDPSQERFLKGWLNRVNHVRAACGLPEEEM